MRSIMSFIFLLLLTQVGFAANDVEVHINSPQDELVVGDSATVEFWMENDFLLTALSVGFEFSNYTGVVLWDSTYGSHPPLNEEGDAVGAFGLIPSVYSFYDGYLPDSLLFGGAYYPGIFPGIPAGSMRLLYTMKLYIPEGEPGGSLCIDNIFIPPAGQWTFTDPNSNSVVPNYHGCVNASGSDPDCPAVCFDVLGKPVADFSFAPDSGEVPLMVQFTDLTLGQPTSWQWYFGDGGESTLQNPQHEYTTIGDFYPMLIVTNTYGTDTMVSTIPVQVIPPPPPIADFTFSPDSGEAPLTVQFTDQSLNDPTSWHWYFGDGGESFLQNPQHQYTALGTFYPVLIVSNTWDADTMTSTIPVIVTPPPDPIADFSFAPDSGEAPLDVQFTDLSLNDPTSWHWYFGDGGESFLQNPLHQYTALGTFYPKLVVSHTYGSDSMTSTIPVIVTAPPDPIADFTFDPQCGEVPLVVQFTNLSQNNPTSYKWLFGDGYTSTSQNPQHTYQTAGVYYPMLIASTAYASDTMTSLDPVVAYDPLIDDFVAYPTGGYIPMTVIFDISMLGTPDDYYWDFGDGDTSPEAEPFHTYTTAGDFTVMLIASRDHGFCMQYDTARKVGLIHVSGVKADFHALQTAGQDPFEVYFLDDSEGSPTSWFWRFGDGQTSTVQHPTHEYQNSGYYDVYLRVNDGYSTDSTVKYGYIFVGNSAYADLYAYNYDAGAVPDEDLSIFCTWTNVGTDDADNCELKILPPSEMIFSDVFPGDILTGTYSGYSFSGDTIVIPLGTIQPTPLNGGWVEVAGDLPGTVSVGDTLVCQSWLSTTSSEANPGDNHALHEIVVVASIDNNEKYAWPEGVGSQHEIPPGQRLTYMLTFENSPGAGSDLTYIYAVDTLDPNLDWSTLAFGAMSHPGDCGYHFNPFTGEIVWFCDSIMLPPNNLPPVGEGYFTLAVSPKSDLANHTQLFNSAWFKFDHYDWLDVPYGGPLFRTIKYPYLCGDVNQDEKINVMDVVYIINYIFKPSPPPDPYESGDVNCDGTVNIMDAVFIINYIFTGGKIPCDIDGDDITDC